MFWSVISSFVHKDGSKEVSIIDERVWEGVEHLLGNICLGAICTHPKPCLRTLVASPTVRSCHRAKKNLRAGRDYIHYRLYDHSFCNKRLIRDRPC